MKAVKESDNVAEIQSKIDALNEASMPLGEAVYKAQAEEASADGGPDMDGADPKDGAAGGATDDNVVDADFEEVDDTKDEKSA